jgi:hypothetical protein
MPAVDDDVLAAYREAIAPASLAAFTNFRASAAAADARAADAADARALAAAMWSQLEQPPSAGQQAAVDRVNDFTRARMREDGFYRRILPAVQVDDADLTREVSADRPVLVIDRAIDTPADNVAAISIPFGTLPANLYIRGPRYQVAFDRISDRVASQGNAQYGDCVPAPVPRFAETRICSRISFARKPRRLLKPVQRFSLEGLLAGPSRFARKHRRLRPLPADEASVFLLPIQSQSQRAAFLLPSCCNRCIIYGIPESGTC